MEYVTVRGESVPAIGLGTWQLRGSDCRDAVESALELGYRHLDTAEYYRNEDAVGEAIAAADADREELFVTTKVWKSHLRREAVLAAFADSRRRLGLEYVDLLLIHRPNDRVPLEETLGAMNELVDDGRVRHVGVSNFSVRRLQEAIDVSDAPIFTDQVAYHPFDADPELRSTCADEEVLLTAYSPLAKGRAARDDDLAAIGERHGKTAAQVALRWLIQQPFVAAIPKAASRAHQRENLDVFDFELSEAEMREIAGLGGGPADRLRSWLGI